MKLLLSFAVFAVAFCGPRGGGGHGGHHGGPGGPGGFPFPPPPFLKGANATVRQEYQEIFKNNNTIAQQEQDEATWAAKYGLTDQVTAFNANKTALMNEMKQNVTNLIGQLSAGFQKLTSIVENKDQTRAQLKEQIMAFKNSTPQVAQVLFFLPSVFAPHHGGFKGGKGGMGGGFNGGPNNFNGGGRGGFQGFQGGRH